MTEEQINEKALEVYPVVSSNDGEWHDGHTDSNYKERKGYLKALNDIESLPKIKGWIARDLGNEVELNLFTENPIRGGFNWFVSNGDIIRLNRNIFPELKWEDKPIEVELIIRKV